MGSISNMAGDDVQVKVCQQEIVKIDLQIRALIQDIRECEGPKSVLHDLNQNVRAKVLNVRTRIEELERLAAEQDKETDKTILLKDAENHKKQLSCTQTSLRKANLACSIALERKEKENLFEGGSEIRQRGKSGKEDLAKTASGITESLMSLSRTMSDQVQRSEQTMTSLVSSSKQVNETGDEFRSMTGHIQNSRKLLTKYSRREFTDKLIIFLALVFFFSTVLYIVKKRIFSSDTAK